MKNKRLVIVSPRDSLCLKIYLPLVSYTRPGYFRSPLICSRSLTVEAFDVCGLSRVTDIADQAGALYDHFVLLPLTHYNLAPNVVEHQPTPENINFPCQEGPAHIRCQPDPSRR